MQTPERDGVHVAHVPAVVGEGGPRRWSVLGKKASE